MVGLAHDGDAAADGLHGDAHGFPSLVRGELVELAGEGGQARRAHVPVRRERAERGEPVTVDGLVLPEGNGNDGDHAPDLSHGHHLRFVVAIRR